MSREDRAEQRRLRVTGEVRAHRPRYHALRAALLDAVTLLPPNRVHLLRTETAATIAALTAPQEPE